MNENTFETPPELRVVLGMFYMPCTCYPSSIMPSESLHFIYIAALMGCPSQSEKKIQARISQGYLCPQGQRKGNNTMTRPRDNGCRPCWAEQWWVII